MLLCIHRKGEAISFKLIEVAEYERPFPIGVNKKRCFPIGCGRIWKGFSNWCKQNNRVFSYWVWHNMKGLFSYWCKQNKRFFPIGCDIIWKGFFLMYWCKQNKRFFPIGCGRIWEGFFYWCKQNKRVYPIGCGRIWKGSFLMGVNKIKVFFLLGVA